MTFHSTILILPGLGNSGDQHWQTLWEKKFNFTRIIQKEWDSPDCAEWASHLDEMVQHFDLSKVILVGHSSACALVAFWADKYKRKIKGALLVGPSDSEADSYPKEPTGFAPMPLNRIPFPTIVVASTNDIYVTKERATYFSDCWRSELVSVGEKGHINSASNLGLWEEGLELLKKLDGV